MPWYRIQSTPFYSILDIQKVYWTENVHLNAWTHILVICRSFTYSPPHWDNGFTLFNMWRYRASDKNTSIFGVWDNLLIPRHGFSFLSVGQDNVATRAMHSLAARMHDNDRVTQLLKKDLNSPNSQKEFTCCSHCYEQLQGGREFTIKSSF